MIEISGDLIVIGLYLLLILGIGFWASRKVKGTEDYTIAGRRLGFPLLLGTLIGTAIGAASSIGKAGKAYEVGIAIFFVTLSYPLGYLLFSFIAPTIRRIKIWTIPDALYLRYGKILTIVAAVIMILGIIALFGGQLIAVGLVVTAILGKFGITYTQAIVGAAIIMILYTMIGGLLAVAYTDLIQTIIILLTVGIILPIMILSEVGGVGPAIENIKPLPGNFWGGMSWAYMVGIFITNVAICLIDPSLWQRTSAAKDAGAIQKSLWITSGIHIYFTFIAVFLGLMALNLFPGLLTSQEGADAAIPKLITLYMPPIIRGLCLAAMMAIMMSTADTALLIAGTTLSRDIVKQLRPKTADKSLLLIARLFILFIGIIGILFALNMKGIFDILLLSFAIFVAGIFVPTMAAIFWKKATKAGALISSIVASVAVVFLFGLKMSGKLSPWLEPIVVSIIISFVLMVVISLITYNPEKATPRLADLA